MWLLCRIREMVELVYETIREPKRIVDVPVALGKLLAAPRERFFKSVGPRLPTASRACRRLWMLLLLLQ